VADSRRGALTEASACFLLPLHLKRTYSTSRRSRARAW
jgi:hypothetical protein